MGSGLSRDKTKNIAKKFHEKERKRLDKRIEIQYSVPVKNHYETEAEKWTRIN
ncbi:MAG: hypothetical protein MR324_03385 [Lachnospiraceae bacterium]|nr:hypothetical protein [Lachnospiraceae bacterium]